LGIEALSVGGHGLLFGRGVDPLAGLAATVGIDIVVKERAEDLLNAILSAELSSSAVVDPGALILAVPSLDLFVFTILNLFFQHFCSLAFVDSGYF
jgi:hypothetical protein